MADTCWYKSNKRMRLDNGCNNNVNDEIKESDHWSCSGDTSLVEAEILEDMGVSMLADGEASRESLLKTQECTISPRHFKSIKKVDDEELYKKQKMFRTSTLETDRIDRLDPFEDLVDLKEVPAGDFSGIANESGYSSRVEPENFVESKENVLKEDSNSNDDTDKNATDPFYLFRRKKKLSITGEDKFNRLSDEMILMILKWLPKKSLVRSMLVCKRWCQIARDEALWTRLDLGNRVLSKGTLSYIVPRGVQILRLAQSELSTPGFLNDVNLENYTSKLQYLDLSMAVISDNDLSTLLSLCKNLKKLSLEKCTLNKECCESIGQNQDLQFLNLTMCDGINGSVEKIMNLQRLTALNMSWCGLDAESMTSLCRLMPESVTRLNIAGCRKTLNDDDIKNLIEKCPRLIELDLSDCTLLTSNAVQYLFKLTELEHLSLSRCYSIPTMMYARLAQMPSLRYLDIFGLMPEELFKTFQSKCENVKINKFQFSSIARPTTGERRTSIWGLRVRD